METKQRAGGEKNAGGGCLSSTFRACTCNMHMCASMNADMLMLSTCLCVNKRNILPQLKTMESSFGIVFGNLYMGKVIENS